MPYDPEIHHRRSIRLRGYDYSQPGSYYVTLCTQGKEHLFGQIVEGEMHRNEWGDHVVCCWEWLAQRYPYIDLDEWTVLPNHLHGIIVITDGRGANRWAGWSAPSKLCPPTTLTNYGARQPAHYGSEIFTITSSATKMN
jgi:hypothetical protein